MENSSYQNSENSLYRPNFLTNSNCAMHWSNNCSNPFTSQTMESKFDYPNYNTFNDPFCCTQTGNSKFLSGFNEMCDKYREPVSESYDRYSSPNTRIWTDIDQSTASEATSWGIMFPNSDTTMKNHVNNDRCLIQDNTNGFNEQYLYGSRLSSPGASLSLHNLEQTLSHLNLGENRCSYGGDSAPSPGKKTWALIVGKSARTSFPPVTALKPGSELTVPTVNSRQMDLVPTKARFFVIKSYSEDDVFRSIKYEIWCSTENGNRKLDSAYRQSGAEMPIYLFFSVNGSGHFCGVATMSSAVDYRARAGVWAQGKWKGQFAVRWLLVKDVPNSQLRHIRVETNENKPVTNSRDVTEIPLERGRQVLKIVAAFKATSSIYDDFDHYEQREKSESAS